MRCSMVLQCILKIQSLPTSSSTVTRETEQMTPKNKKKLFARKTKLLYMKQASGKSFSKQPNGMKPFLYDVVGLSNAFKHTVVAILILMV